MITIRNGKLNIPDDDRFVGFAGDDSVVTKQFYLIGHADADCDYTLCLRFDDDTVRTVPLSAAADGGDTVLTWEVRGEQLYATGVAAAQVRVADSDGSIAHSTKDFFFVGSAVELGEDGAEEDFVTPSQMQNSIDQALEAVTATSPYIDGDGYWCIYDTQAGEYVRTSYHVSGIAPDSAMSGSSDNAVANRVIKQYVDGKAVDCNTFATGYADMKTADKVPDTRKIALIPLSADISAAELTAALRPQMYRTDVLPGVTSGARGQFGIGMNGEVFFCSSTDNWVHLADYGDLYDKMDLASEVAAADIGDVEDGSIFFSSGVLYIKHNDAAVAIAKANDVYTKAEINTMLGNIESLLAAV